VLAQLNLTTQQIAEVVEALPEAMEEAAALLSEGV
jgi:hypothetical protein